MAGGPNDGYPGGDLIMASTLPDSDIILRAGDVFFSGFKWLYPRVDCC
jgi:hypothetical protein